MFVFNEKCHDVNKCIYCKYWLGYSPEVKIGRVCTYKDCKGLCKLDESDSEHKSSGLCHKFVKSLKYL